MKIPITSRWYGKRFLNKEIHYVGFGKKPKFVKADGSFTLGKHILEALSEKFKNFDLVISFNGKSLVKKEGRKTTVTLSFQDYSLFKKAFAEKKRVVATKVVKGQLPTLYPKFFSTTEKLIVYESGLFSELLSPTFDPARLGRADLDALIAFIPKLLGYKVGTESKAIKAVVSQKEVLQLSYLEKFISDLSKRLTKKQSESSWQKYFYENILLLQEGYIEKIEKLNIDIDPKFPDFCLVTGDGYLDVLEIKTPDTPLLRYDDSHKNYYWSPDLAKAIAQTEKYIDVIAKNNDRVRNYIRDKYQIDLKIIKPRGIIIAGSAKSMIESDKRDDFRLLAGSLKNVEVMTYSELEQLMMNRLHTLRKINQGKR